MKPRTIITTDMECDDMNSFIHLCLYLNEMELQGIVYTASRYHFNGDGVHTLGEVTPHYSTRGNAALDPHSAVKGADPEAASLKEYRPFPTHWIEDLIEKEYAEAYEFLSQNAAGYPSPQELLKITKMGNTAFEGDVRFDTEGSDLIREKLLDDDERPLYLQSWGGMNTIVRALMSIGEEYQNTDLWPEIQKKVTDKAVVFGVINGMGQDHSWLDHGISLFPQLKLLRSELIYGMYFAPFKEQPDSIHLYRGEWLKEHIKFNHGSLMNRYGLMADGIIYEGEPFKNQYGINPVIDWGIPGFEKTVFEKYDFLGEGDSNCYIPLLDTGLRGLENGIYGTIIGRLFQDGESLEAGYDHFNGKAGVPKRFFKAYQEEFAARAEWCCKPYEECVHPAAVTVKESDVSGKPGVTVSLDVDARTKDDSLLSVCWEYYREGSVYSGRGYPQVFDVLDMKTQFTIPHDAKAGDFFNFVLKAKTVKKESITRYGQVIIHVL